MENQLEIKRVLTEIERLETRKKMFTIAAVVILVASLVFYKLLENNPMWIIGLLFMAIFIFLVFFSTIQLNKRYLVVKKWVKAGGTIQKQ